jgi:hypothetical protein
MGGKFNYKLVTCQRAIPINRGGNENCLRERIFDINSLNLITLRRPRDDRKIAPTDQGASWVISLSENQPVGLFLSRTKTTIERPLAITGGPPSPGVVLIA